MNTLHIDSVLKTYRNKQILTDIFLLCERGDIIGLLGRNGSGKSTLMKIIFGSIPADRKFIKVGENINNNTFENLNKIKYLPQHNFLPNHIRLNTIIDLFCDRKNAKLLKNKAILKTLLNKKSKQLSGGEKRFFEVLLIIYSSAQFVLLDEPFNGIAPIHKEEIKKIIIEQSKFKGFIITDHDYRNIIDVSTKNILLHDGGTKSISNLQDLTLWGYLSATE